MRVFEKTEKRASEFSQRSSFQMQNQGPIPEVALLPRVGALGAQRDFRISPGR